MSYADVGIDPAQIAPHLQSLNAHLDRLAVAAQFVARQVEYRAACAKFWEGAQELAAGYFRRPPRVHKSMTPAGFNEALVSRFRTGASYAELRQMIAAADV